MNRPTESSNKTESGGVSTRTVEKLCVATASIGLAAAAYAISFPLFYAFAGLGVAYLLSSSCAT